jgi:hypothetical protein
MSSLVYQSTPEIIVLQWRHKEVNKMPELEHCLIDVKTALRVKNKDVITDPKFLCPSCKEPVRPHTQSGTGGAHFEHHENNLDCPLCYKGTAKKLYAAYKAEKKAWRESGGKGEFLEVFLAKHKIISIEKPDASE